jgi:tetratricopeptide (TPR) repeat protein
MPSVNVSSRVPAKSATTAMPAAGTGCAPQALLSPATASPLQAALILRHLFDAVVPSDDAPNWIPASISWLERSLELDPDDRATYLKLIRIHRRQKNLKAARATVDAAQARFVDDPAVLLEAVETALAGNAFKKAVTLAKRLLELDPINLRVRALIGQAHLSHARKQIRLHRPDAVGREVDLAEQWLTSPGERSLGKLLRGLSADSVPATGLLREAASELGGGLFAAFQLLLESHRVGAKGRPASCVGQGSISPHCRRRVRCWRSFKGSMTSVKTDQRWLAAILEPLRAPLRRAAAADFSESERISICETLLRREENALLGAYAAAGLKRSPGRPVLVYFATRAKHHPGFFVRISEADQRTLDQALEVARAEGDERTVLRIRELMHPEGLFGDADPDDFDDFDPFADDDEEGDARFACRRCARDVRDDDLARQPDPARDHPNGEGGGAAERSCVSSSARRAAIAGRSRSSWSTIYSKTSRQRSRVPRNPVRRRTTHRKASSMIDPYRVLGVDYTASDETIRAAYLAAIRQSPPERDRERFENVRQAYEAISDQRRRLAHELFDHSEPTLDDLLSAVSSDFEPRYPSEQQLLRVLGAK